MSVQPYGVIKGIITKSKLAGRPTQPHLHLLMETTVNGTQGVQEDLAVNVLSMDQSQVRYAVVNRAPANAAALTALPVGIRHCNGDDGIALDFVRTPGLINESEMTLLDVSELHPTSMHDVVIDLVQRAITEKATVYAFGQLFGTKGKANPFWGFADDAGGHDMHMNQGNQAGNHDQDNGTFQDGCLLAQWPDGTWSGLFIAFQSQSWNTDNNGDAI